PRATLRQVARELVAWRDFDSPWARRPFARESDIDALLDALAALGPGALSARNRDTEALLAAQVPLGPEPPADDRDFLGRSLHAIASFVAEVARRERPSGRDYDGVEGRLVGVVLEG